MQDTNYDSKFWENGISVGTTFLLSDEQAITDSLRKGKGAKGLEYIVRSIQSIREANNLCKWFIFDIEECGSEENLEKLILMVKVVDQAMDIRIYYPANGLECGDRFDMISKKMYELFEQPEDPDHYRLEDLVFAKVMIMNDMIVDGEPRRVEYNMKDSGTLFCNCEYSPARSGIGRVFCSVTEYCSDVPCENPELLILEIGSGNRGGLIQMFVGTAVSPEDVSVL